MRRAAATRQRGVQQLRLALALAAAAAEVAAHAAAHLRQQLWVAAASRQTHAQTQLTCRF